MSNHFVLWIKKLQKKLKYNCISIKVFNKDENEKNHINCNLLADVHLC